MPNYTAIVTLLTVAFYFFLATRVSAGRRLRLARSARR
jgi:hypothetical protein